MIVDNHGNVKEKSREREEQSREIEGQRRNREQELDLELTRVKQEENALKYTHQTCFDASHCLNLPPKLNREDVTTFFDMFEKLLVGKRRKPGDNFLELARQQGVVFDRWCLIGG